MRATKSFGRILAEEHYLFWKNGGRIKKTATNDRHLDRTLRNGSDTSNSK